MELTDYVSRRGWEYKIYRDTGPSGAKESRPALDSLLSGVRKRRVPVPNHQRAAVENLAQMVTNGDESDQRLERLPPATQRIQ